MDDYRSPRKADELTASMRTNGKTIPLDSTRKYDIDITGHESRNIEEDSHPHARTQDEGSKSQELLPTEGHSELQGGTPKKGPTERRTPPKPELDRKIVLDPRKLPQKSPRKRKPHTEDKPLARKKGVSGEICQTCGLRRIDWPYCGWLGRPHPPALSIHQMQVSQRIFLNVLCHSSTKNGPEMEPAALNNETLPPGNSF
ncbi:hypothetical protein XU18_4928 [Perkinsela sp. CCAP 1560/4]|nr:hypothetical protein XU18_4928 [Perkinsela sp. CCAP 1560/4]|eukprot:KNH03733.1 hypothetical protein XU18_4928 [Perkinsela sp. CCAP 1560/4]